MFRLRVPHYVDVAVAVRAVGAALAEVVALEGDEVDGDALGPELPGLALQSLLELLPAACPLSSAELRGGDGLAGARLGVGVVGRSARAFFGVFLFAPFRAAVLEPYLELEKMIRAEDLLLLNTKLFDNLNNCLVWSGQK